MDTNAASRDTYREQLDAMYAWCEALCTGDSAGTEEEVSQFWADDGRMITNGKLEATGITELTKHFALFPQKYRRVEIRRPFHAYFEAGTSAVVEYEIVGELHSGETAIGTGEVNRQHVRVIATFTMHDGLITEMREVAAANAGDS